MDFNTSRPASTEYELHNFCHSLVDKMENAIDSLGKVQNVYRQAASSSDPQKTTAEFNKSIQALNANPPDLHIDEFEKKITLIDEKVGNLQSGITSQREKIGEIKQNLSQESDPDIKEGLSHEIELLEFVIEGQQEQVNSLLQLKDSLVAIQSRSKMIGIAFATLSSSKDRSIPLFEDICVGLEMTINSCRTTLATASSLVYKPSHEKGVLFISVEEARKISSKLVDDLIKSYHEVELRVYRQIETKTPDKQLPLYLEELSTDLQAFIDLIPTESNKDLIHASFAVDLLHKVHFLARTCPKSVQNIVKADEIACMKKLAEKAATLIVKEEKYLLTIPNDKKHQDLMKKGLEDIELTKNIIEGYGWTTTDQIGYGTFMSQLALLASDNPLGLADLSGGISSTAGLIASAMSVHSAIETIKKTGTDIELVESILDNYRQQLTSSPNKEPLDALCQLLEVKLSYMKLIRTSGSATSAIAGTLGVANSAASIAGTAAGLLFPSAAGIATSIGTGTAGITVVLAAFAGCLFAVNEAKTIKSQLVIEECMNKLDRQTAQLENYHREFVQKSANLVERNLNPARQEVGMKVLEEGFKKKFVAVQQERIKIHQKLSDALEEGSLGRSADVIGAPSEFVYEYRNLTQALLGRGDFHNVFSEFFQTYAPDRLAEFKMDPANAVLRYAFS